MKLNTELNTGDDRAANCVLAADVAGKQEERKKENRPYR